MSSVALSKQLASWSHGLDISSFPADVLLLNKQRIADTIGLMFAGSDTPFGRKVAATAPRQTVGSTLVGFDGRSAPENAALVNGATAHVLEYDDTHLETAIHVASPIVAASLAVAEEVKAPGRDLLIAMALASEISCRLGLVIPGAFHKAGFHPTAIFGVFSSVYALARLKGLDVGQTVSAIGIAASQSAGVMAAWVDGTDSKSLHAGLSAQSAIVAAKLAEQGVSGPLLAFEGPYGLYKTHIQGRERDFDFDRPLRDLGSHWDSLNIAFKPYPAGHFVHAFVDAMLSIVKEHNLHHEDIARIECPIAEHMVQMVCEPEDQKLNPASSWHCRVSLHWSVAEAAVLRRLDRYAYDLNRPEAEAIRALAAKVSYSIDPEGYDRTRWRGHVIVHTKDGKTYEHLETANRGSAQNPLTPEDIFSKFRSNTEHLLSASQIERLYDRIMNLESLEDASQLLPSGRT